MRGDRRRGVLAAAAALVVIVVIVLLNRTDVDETGPATAPGSSPPAATSTLPSAGMTDCAPQPSRCGYPDATNTGIPPGTVLRSVPADVTAGRGWHWDSRGWLEVDGEGAVLENLTVASNVNISASDVTLRNVRIGLGGDTFGISLRRVSDIKVENCEIAGTDAQAGRLLVGIKDIYGDSRNVTVSRCDISRVATGIQMYQGLIEHNYIHDLGYRDGDHTNGTTSNGGTEELVIRHNTVLNPHNQTDAISLFQDFGVEANRLIENNLVGGGAYAIYAGANPGGKPTSNIRVVDNRFATTIFPKGGNFGPVTAFDPGGAGNVWRGNIWDSTGRPVDN